MTREEIKTMRARLTEFVRENRDGWGHEDWEQLLGDLEVAGHDVSDRDAIGAELERIRLTRHLEKLDVRGLGPKRRTALVEWFGRLWEVEQASPDELASVPALNRSVARSLHEALH